MWRAGVDTKMNIGSAGDDDDWETDPDFVVGAEPRVTSSSCWIISIFNHFYTRLSVDYGKVPFNLSFQFQFDSYKVIY